MDVMEKKRDVSGKEASAALRDSLHLNKELVCVCVCVCVCACVCVPTMTEDWPTGLENAPSILPLPPSFHSPLFVFKVFEMTLQSDDAPGHYIV